MRGAVLRYARWLRKRIEFPVRVPVFLSPRVLLERKSGKPTGVFFEPFRFADEPFIVVATGDYLELRRERGRDNALAAILCTLSHEVVHYQQWCARIPCHERGVVLRALGMVRAYSREVDHP